MNQQMNISFGVEGCYSDENNVAILNFVMMRFLFLMPYFFIFMMRRNASKFKVVYSTTSSFRKSRSKVASHSFFVTRHFSELTTCFPLMMIDSC